MISPAFRAMPYCPNLLASQATACAGLPRTAASAAVPAKDHPEVKAMHCYKLLERILKYLKKATLFPAPRVMYRLGQKKRKPGTPSHLILNYRMFTFTLQGRRPEEIL